jgi:hypothetical protein
MKTEPNRQNEKKRHQERVLAALVEFGKKKKWSRRQKQEKSLSGKDLFPMNERPKES